MWWHGMVWYALVWYGMVRCGMVCFGVVCGMFSLWICDNICISPSYETLTWRERERAISEIHAFQPVYLCVSGHPAVWPIRHFHDNLWALYRPSLMISLALFLSFSPTLTLSLSISLSLFIRCIVSLSALSIPIRLLDPPWLQKYNALMKRADDNGLGCSLYYHPQLMIFCTIARWMNPDHQFIPFHPGSQMREPQWDFNQLKSTHMCNPWSNMASWRIPHLLRWCSP